MGVLNVGKRDGVQVSDVSQMFARFFTEAVAEAEQLQQELNANPMLLEIVERKVQELFNRGAGLFLSGLIAKCMSEPSFKSRCEEVRKEYAVPLKAGEDRQIQIRLANGFTCFATTRYCAPIRRPEDDQEVPGIDIELSQFGFSSGDSPGLVSKVARATAIMPLSQACKELQRDGINLDDSVVDRISSRAAQELLTVRERNLASFLSGDLVAGDELAGKTISVQIDGARTRIRSQLQKLCPFENFGKTQSEATGKPSQGRSKEVRRRAMFEALWREPKVITIYVHDSDGRMEKHSQATIDGTFGDADNIQAIVAMHLHRLGAAKAKSISFNSDGAKWIWDRIDAILEQAKIPKTVDIYRILDVYHACENLNKALTVFYPEAKARRDAYRELRTKLRDGGWEEVVNGLVEQYDTKYPEAKTKPEKELTDDQKECCRVINYIRHHGEQRHMNYGMYSLMGLPLGSGAIESAIRRVVNLRMKSNGIFWKIDRAEEMLMLRATVLSDRWDENRLTAKQQMKINQKLSLPKLDTPAPDELATATSA